MNYKVNADLTKEEFDLLTDILNEHAQIARDQFFRFAKTKHLYSEEQNKIKTNDNDLVSFVPHFDAKYYQKEIKQKLIKKHNKLKISEALFKKLVEDNNK